MKKTSGPRILVWDIETAPMLGYVWGLWENNIALNQLKADWHLLSFAAKWLDDSPNKIIYADQRNKKNIEDDKEIVQKLWYLLDEADIVITQNGKAFDAKKINARFLFHNMQPPSSYKHIDTRLIAKKYFAFTSTKLEYMTDKFNVKYKKLKHKQFPGFELWTECLAGNKAAWKQMEKYNKYDVLALEELYHKLAPWDNSINPSLYTDGEPEACGCGSTSFKHNGHAYTATGKFKRYKCMECGAETRDRKNVAQAKYRLKTTR